MHSVQWSGFKGSEEAKRQIAHKKRNLQSQRQPLERMGDFLLTPLSVRSDVDYPQNSHPLEDKVESDGQQARSANVVAGQDDRERDELSPPKGVKRPDQ